MTCNPIVDTFGRFRLSAFGNFCLWMVLCWPLSLSANPRVAVVGIHASQENQTQAASLSPMFRDAFRHSGNLTILSEEASREKLAGRQQALRNAVFLQPARDDIAEARSLANHAEFRDAIKALRHAQAELLYYREHLTSNEDFVETLLLLTQLHFGLEEPEEASQTLSQLVTIAPGLSLDPLRFSPQAIKLHEDLKANAQYATGLEITSTPPGAKAYLDGAFLGVTPCILPKLTQGDHFVRLEGPDGVYFQDFQQRSSGLFQIHGKLAAPEIRATNRLRDSATPDPERVLELYQTLGKFLDADFIPLARLDEDFIEVCLLEVATGHLSPSYQIGLNASGSNAPQLRKLVSFLESYVSPDGTLSREASLTMAIDPDDNPQLKQYFFGNEAGILMVVAPGSSTLSNTGTARPFYKRAWFWATVGGVALATAGATTYGIVAGQSSGTDTVSIQFNLPTTP